LSRIDLIRRPFDRTMQLIEIGPSHNPVIPKADGWQTTIIDHADQAGLIEKYSALGVLTDAIEPVDYVWQEGTLADLIPVEKHGQYDGLIASHVGEHFPDLVGFLKNASSLMNADGKLALALPDKRVCFDFFQPITMTGDVVAAHLEGRTRHERKTFFNQTAYFVWRGEHVGWAHEGGGAPFHIRNSLRDAQRAYDNASVDPKSPYRDTHAWTFTPKSFELLILELNVLGYIDWKIHSIEPTPGVEFHVWLDKGSVSEINLNEQRQAILLAMVLETKDAIQQIESVPNIKRHKLRISEGEEFLTQKYENIFSKKLDLSKPRTFSEKIFCKMIALNRKKDPLITRLTDKHLVRGWVKDKIGSQHLVKVLWTGKEPKQIPFDSLPEQYVIKTNHASGQVIVINSANMLDQKIIYQQLNEWMSQNYYWSQRERQYYEIKPRILIEEFIDDGISDGPLNFRFWCFNGETNIVQVDDQLHAINPFYDLDWNLLPLSYRTNMSKKLIEKPENFQSMVEIANKLSADFDFVRVDLYNIKGKILFNEMTFTPVAGEAKFEPQSWDAKLGDIWKFNPKYQINS